MANEKGPLTITRQTAAEVSRARLEGSVIPVAKTAVTIAVDTDYIGTLPPGTINASKGIYMMDNRVLNGSAGEGGLELHTRCPTGNLVSFCVAPIDGAGSNNASVEIIGFNVSGGSVFTAAGQPRPFNPPPGGGPQGSFWIGQAMQQGTQTYQIQVKVTVGLLQPVSYYISWDPFITAS